MKTEQIEAMTMRALDTIDNDSFRITRPGQPYEGPHMGVRLTKQLATHRWFCLFIRFDNPTTDTYLDVAAAKQISPSAMQKLISKAWCVRQIKWRTGESGILIEVGTIGTYVAAPIDLPGAAKIIKA
jgi:hypothetical protein